MNLIAAEVLEYAEQHSAEEPVLLKELRRETWQKVLAPRMLSGHLQGRLLAMISTMIQPKTILEIGTYTGYATLCLAEGLSENGHIHTIDINEELVDFQQKYFKKAGFEKKITQHTGEALALIPTIEERFDLVFIDADKKNYSAYFDLIIDKVNKGGMILTDNVLWGGKVLKNVRDNDRETLEIKAFNKKINEDSRVVNLLLPFRDGISIALKS